MLTGVGPIGIDEAAEEKASEEFIDCGRPAALCKAHTVKFRTVLGRGCLDRRQNGPSVGAFHCFGGVVFVRDAMMMSKNG